MKENVIIAKHKVTPVNLTKDEDKAKASSA